MLARRGRHPRPSVPDVPFPLDLPDDAPERIAERLGGYRLRRRARSCGGTLEWWVARELARRLAVPVATGVRSGAPGIGGDLDVVAAVEGKLLYVELKSSPPKHVSRAELRAFLARVR